MENSRRRKRKGKEGKEKGSKQGKEELHRMRNIRVRILNGWHGLADNTSSAAARVDYGFTVSIICKY